MIGRHQILGSNILRKLSLAIVFGFHLVVFMVGTVLASLFVYHHFVEVVQLIVAIAILLCVGLLLPGFAPSGPYAAGLEAKLSALECQQEQRNF